jgi:putative restriction endonuclease
MFGGGTRYVETLDEILEFVESYQPTTDELVAWHRGTFSNVSSRESILRRVDYLRQADFLAETDDRWSLGSSGREYVRAGDVATLLEIMCDRNVGLRSLLYALSAGSMTLEEVSNQQLDTHPELGWNREQTDMAAQRVNWLRSMNLVEKRDEECHLTDDRRDFAESAVTEWADSEWALSAESDGMTAGTYETTVEARSVDPEFRATVLSCHDRTCPVSGVDHPGLLDVAHVLPWADYPEQRADLSNVLPLSKTHHAAFDRELFTIDREYRLRVNPDFETESELLRRTVVEQAGERVSIPDGSVNPEYLARHNEEIVWT